MPKIVETRSSLSRSSSSIESQHVFYLTSEHVSLSVQHTVTAGSGSGEEPLMQ